MHGIDLNQYPVGDFVGHDYGYGFDQFGGDPPFHDYAGDDDDSLPAYSAQFHGSHHETADDEDECADKNIHEDPDGHEQYVPPVRNALEKGKSRSSAIPSSGPTVRTPIAPTSSTIAPQCNIMSICEIPPAVGDLYSKNDLKTKLSVYAMRNNFEFKVKRSSTTRYEVKCVDSNCEWRLRATNCDGTELFMVKDFVNNHTCNIDSVSRNHHQASSSVVAECIKPKFSGVPRQYRPKDIIQDFQQDYGVNMSYQKAWRAKETALRCLWGSPEESYAMLPAYCHVLEAKNVGSVARICTDSNNRFMYCFVSIRASIRGFVSSMRPVIAVDATHLKERYRGVMYVAAAMDGNGQIYPVAFGVGPAETHDAYTWFFQRLKEVIGVPDGLMFITDRHKSIESALHSVYPDVPHGLCIHHMMMNIRSKSFPNSEMICALFMKAAKAYTVNEFELQMQHIESTSPGAAQYIRTVDTARWARCHSPVRRYTIMTTNIAESMWAVLKDARCKPIVPMIDDIRSLLEKWFYERRNEAGNNTGHVSPWLENELKIRLNVAIRLKVYPINMNVLRVNGSGINECVDLLQKSCTCMEFDLDEYPCVHALAACRERNLSYYSMCSRYYKTETLRNAYADSIFPVGDKKRWSIPDEIQSITILPPAKASRPSGRPRTSRIPSTGEVIHVRRCGRCGNMGHNQKTCTNPIPLDANISGRHSTDNESGGI